MYRFVTQVTPLHEADTFIESNAIFVREEMPVAPPCSPYLYGDARVSPSWCPDLVDSIDNDLHSTAFSST